MTDATTLDQVLSELAREGELFERLPGGRVRCHACGHRCLIPPGQRGVCKVRWNDDGRLMVPGGYVAALQLDPVEKKPFYHAYPGARALSFGMLGCDYHCAHCQNALTSQALRDPAAGVERGYRPGHTLAHWRRLVKVGVQKGERNSSIASLAGHLFWRGIDPKVTLDLLLCWNARRCRPPLSEEEVARTVDSIMRRHESDDARAGTS